MATPFDCDDGPGTLSDLTPAERNKLLAREKFQHTLREQVQALESAVLDTPPGDDLNIVQLMEDFIGPAAIAARDYRMWLDRHPSPASTPQERSYTIDELD